MTGMMEWYTGMTYNELWALPEEERREVILRALAEHRAEMDWAESFIGKIRKAIDETPDPEATK